MKTSKSIIGILGGVAIGAALGVLFAPDKGTKTRKKIADKGSDLASAAQDKYNSALSKGEELVDKAKDIIKSEVETAKKQMSK